MKILKTNNSISVEINNPEILRSISFFDHFNIDLYNKIKKLKNEFTPLPNRVKK
jgi:hypothetical protein